NLLQAAYEKIDMDDAFAAMEMEGTTFADWEDENGELPVDGEEEIGYNENKRLVDNPFDETGKLKPNASYMSGEFDYLYETDGISRISRFKTDHLRLTEREGRLSHNPNTPGKLEKDHAGHLIGDRFGGSPELDNLISQSSGVNQSQYKKIENQWAKAIKEGKQVKVDVEILYEGDSMRPTGFNIQYEVNGKYFERNISN
ncbi:MAG: DNA/RNA non-specific endonuclease, partial [Christensenellales bacterium]